MTKHKIRINVLPGQPTDGTGKVCVHLFLKDEKGSFIEPHVLHPVVDDNGNVIKQQLVAKPTRGRIACSITLKPQVKPNKDGTRSILLRSDDANAVTCPKCLATPECKKLLTNGENNG